MLEDGTTIHPDLAWPDVSLYVEVDHLSWHGGRLENVYDRRRDRQVARLGATVLRVTDVDLDRRLDATVDDIARVFRRRRGG